MIKTILDNNVIDCTSAVYVEIEIEISWLIGQDVIYNEN